ncbi:MAG TPA: hypothetical protein VJ901_17175 [Thermoanaerobaculia bacterium]|nr:hypothetical protein [Thermoanaerobaculia bacterium]
MTLCLVADMSEAVGLEANLIRRKEVEISRDHIQAPLSGAPLRHAFSGLLTVLEDASAPNWDGYGSAPVNLKSARHAIRLLSHMPLELPAPEISADPDGEVSIEWYREPRRLFSISVSASGNLSYAGMFGKSSVYGTEEFTNEYLPVLIRAYLSRLFGPNGRLA